jgi:hypothetical protein
VGEEGTNGHATVGGDASGESRERRSKGRAASQRWLVHIALIATLVLSLLLEPVLTLHIVFGLIFVSLVAAHLWQRRHVSKSLMARLRTPRGWPQPGGRLALADLALLAVTAVMLASGLWDWLAGRTTIRWHALSGVLLTGVTIVHVVRRRRRLRRSRIR